jgi:colanic acid biosynthesis protein WcaH
MSGFLDARTFRTVVAAAPLLSIDLLVLNARGELLLGRRRNAPARGFWFVPGGRVRKNERLDAAFERLTETELGQRYVRACARLLGVYEHFYEDSVFATDGPGPSTHYVVLAYALRLPEGSPLRLPPEQHADYRWWPLTELCSEASVHPFVRDYVPALR